MNTSNPAPAAGFGDPANNIPDPSFGTAVSAGCQRPMASYIDHAPVAPVDLLRSGSMNYGIKPNFILPLYYSISESNQSYWWIMTDSSDQGNAEQLGSTSPPGSGSLRKVWTEMG